MPIIFTCGEQVNCPVWDSGILEMLKSRCRGAGADHETTTRNIESDREENHVDVGGGYRGISDDDESSNVAQIICVPVEHRGSIVYALHDGWTMGSGKRSIGRQGVPGLGITGVEPGRGCNPRARQPRAKSNLKVYGGT